MAALLSVNIGSSSVKFALYALDASDQPSELVLSGQVSGLGAGLKGGAVPDCRFMRQGQGAQKQVSVPTGADLRAGLDMLANILSSDGSLPVVKAVAHRVVHGGAFYKTAVRVDPVVLANLHSLTSLAPLHQPYNLAGIKLFGALWPGVAQVACFDTAFHADQSPLEQHFALPQALYQQGIRRYGFHGLSYQFILQSLLQRSQRARGRLMMMHLGNGASVCGARDARSQTSSMGFSAVDGLMMGSRSGALDPGVLLYLLEQGWDRARLEDLLYRRSGLLGVSGISADMRQLRADGSAPARFAIDLFVHRLVRECGAIMSTLGGLDVMAFSGGIGEHDADIRARCCAALSWHGVRLDAQLNRGADGSRPIAIHAADSPIEVWVVPTDEGLIAAQQAATVLQT